MNSTFKPLSGAFFDGVEESYLTANRARVAKAGLKWQEQNDSEIILVPEGTRVRRLGPSEASSVYVDAYDITLPADGRVVKIEYPKSRRPRFRRE